jgi:hypothetical protein
MSNGHNTGKRGVFSSPLAITGILLLASAVLLLGIVYIIGAEPTHKFYALLSTGLGFLAVNPAVIRLRHSMLWQGIMIGAAIASLCWMFI